MASRSSLVVETRVEMRRAEVELGREIRNARVIRIDGVAIGVEAEARIRDAQPVDRRCALKRRDGGVAIMILLVADTAANREMLALHREALRSSFPLDTRQVLAALRSGRAPSASGIVVL